MPRGYGRNGRVKQTKKKENKKMAAMTIRVIGKWSVQSSVIFGYSCFNRRQIKIWWIAERGMWDVSYSFKANFIVRRRKWFISQVINLCKSLSQDIMKPSLMEGFLKDQVFLWILKTSSFYQTDCITYKNPHITDAVCAGHIR